jgi:glucose-6-phosphate-specific signal transduction histidine kinase
MATAAGITHTRLIASGALAQIVLLLLSLGGAAGAWWGSDHVRRLILPLWALLARAPTAPIAALAVFALTLAVARAAPRRRRRQRAARHLALAQGAQQGRAALLEEVRIIVHGHLKPYVVEIAYHLAAVRAATDPGQQELLLRELDQSVQQLRAQVLRLHGQVAQPIGEHATALPNDLERTLREVTWNFRSLLPRVTLEVAGAPRALPQRAVVALELLLYNALTNAHTHAQARLVQVRLHYELDIVRLAVSDDGCGFDVAQTRTRARGRGLHDLERTAAALGGHVEIFSIVGQGSEISMRLPLPRPTLGWAAVRVPAEYDKEVIDERT